MKKRISKIMDWLFRIFLSGSIGVIMVAMALTKSGLDTELPPWFIGCINLAMLILIVFVLPFFCVRSLLCRKRERAQAVKKTLEAIAKLETKQVTIRKTARKLGPYRPKNWAAKWIAYSNSLPISRQRYQLNGRDLPDIPRVNE